MALPLDRLLALAGRGYHVFPLEVNGKRPIPGSHGVNDATTDPDRITAWYNQHPSCNWGLACGPSGLLVVDLDIKSGHDGITNWNEAATAADPDRLPTAKVETPSGGLHLYYKGSGPSTASKIAPGIDTRGEGGYVLLPGSTIDGKAYEFKGGQPAELPAWLVDRLKPTAPAPAVALSSDLDTAAAILRAGQYLAEAPAAIEGEGGDATTLRVAMRVKDLGISEPTCVELMAAAYNPRCLPPWDGEELARKVNNAYKYGKQAPGSAGGSPFAPVESPEPVKLAGIPSIKASEFDPAAIKPRPWILGHDLIAGFITATVAQGGAGKSMVTMLEALAVASGRELTGVKVHKPGAAWIYNVEDPMDELGRRIIAAADHHRVPLAELGNLHISSGRMAPLILAQSNRGEVTTNVKAFEQVIDFITTNRITLWVLDPFIHVHMCDENSNAEMSHVMLILGAIAERTGCAISLVHHTTKGTGGEGNMDKARGASAFGGAVRIMRTVATMNEKDAESFGISADRRKWYLRLDDAKGNMAPPAEAARWFEKHDHVLVNGDHVGAVACTSLKRVVSEDFSEARDAVFDAIRLGHLHPEVYQLDEVVPVLKKHDELERFKGKRADTLAREIGEAFTGAPVYVPNAMLQVECQGKELVISKGNRDWLE